METSASEPLMSRREAFTKRQNRAGIVGPGRAQREPAYRLGGARRKGGVTMDQASVWNVGTCRPDAKGESQAGSPCEGERTNAGHRGGATRSSVEGRETGWSKGVAPVSESHGSTGNGRNLWA